jgi:hydroxymethylpyrimidine/phosphomethylpyrimidine kinase
VEAVLAELVPLATLVTPNLDEAAILAGIAVADVDGMHRAARRLVAAGARAALVKGGHLRGAELVDVLHDGRAGRASFAGRAWTTRSTHGTGCTLSAAVAALLARGRDLDGGG